jgi:hypothetical protein
LRAARGTRHAVAAADAYSAAVVRTAPLTDLALNVFNQFMQFEHRRERPISARAFARRLAQHGGVAAIIIGCSVVLGTGGYHWLGGASWLDSFLNACMILGGMGQVGDINPTSGKLFASIFALYAGMIFLIVAAVLLTPIFHRVLHRFHWEGDNARQG